MMKLRDAYGEYYTASGTASTIGRQLALIRADGGSSPGLDHLTAVNQGHRPAAVTAGGAVSAGAFAIGRYCWLIQHSTTRAVPRSTSRKYLDIEPVQSTEQLASIHSRLPLRLSADGITRTVGSLTVASRRARSRTRTASCSRVVSSFMSAKLFMAIMFAYPTPGRGRPIDADIARSVTGVSSY